MVSNVSDEWNTAGELRAIALRLIALMVLSANVILAGTTEVVGLYLIVIAAYAVIGVLSFVWRAVQRRRSWLMAAFASCDALLVATVLYPHILGSPINYNHDLTTTALVMVYILLNHVGLKQEKSTILVFSCLSLTLWLAMLVISALKHAQTGRASFLGALLNQDLGLAISFGFTAFATYVLARDHETARRAALKAEMRRYNLSRFFSAHVLNDLQEGSPALALRRREAAVMFIDLRSFTTFSETAPAHHLAMLLAEYRTIVSDVIFRHGGTIDKFMGDGVMAVFGHPAATANDADKALACSLELVTVLREWRRRNDREGLPALAAGIGLHYGTVVSGVLESGRHQELTVVGDTVNVAQRLEGIAEPLAASLVVSASLMDRLTGDIPDVAWHRHPAVTVRGRKLPIDIWYLTHETNR